MRPSSHLPLFIALFTTVLFVSTSIVTSFAATGTAQTSVQSIADIGLKFPFKPGSEWKITRGTDGANHLQDWNWNAVDFVPVGGSKECEGQPVLAAAPGTIEKVAVDRDGANMVFIDHGNDYHSLYIHLASPSPLSVGTRVSYGTEIGKCGNTGNSDGAHIHFQVFQGKWSATNGSVPVPIDGVTDPNKMKSGQRGFYSTNRPLISNDFNGDGKPEIYALARTGGGGGKTDVYIVNSADNYQSLILNIGSGLEYTENPSWVFGLGDYNGDGKPDLFGINKIGTGAGHKTEVHILNGQDDTLNGPNNFQSFLLRKETKLEDTGSDSRWVFAVGDYNGDGKPDLYAINKIGTDVGHKTEVHILDGKSDFQSFLLRKETKLEDTGSDNRWVFGLGDYNGDGKLDLYAINKIGTDVGHKTEVHILDGKGDFQSFLLRKETKLPDTGSDSLWAFNVADYNGDGKPDIYAMPKTGGGSNKTDVYVLDGADEYKSYIFNTATILNYATPICAWDFVTGTSCVEATQNPQPTPQPPTNYPLYLPIIQN